VIYRRNYEATKPQSWPRGKITTPADDAIVSQTEYPHQVSSKIVKGSFEYVAGMQECNECSEDATSTFTRSSVAARECGVPLVETFERGYQLGLDVKQLETNSAKASASKRARELADAIKQANDAEKRALAFEKQAETAKEDLKNAKSEFVKQAKRTATRLEKLGPATSALSAANTTIRKHVKDISSLTKERDAKAEEINKLQAKFEVLERTRVPACTPVAAADIATELQSYFEDARTSAVAAIRSYFEGAQFVAARKSEIRDVVAGLIQSQHMTPANITQQQSQHHHHGQTVHHSGNFNAHSLNYAASDLQWNPWNDDDADIQGWAQSSSASASSSSMARGGQGTWRESQGSGSGRQSAGGSRSSTGNKGKGGGTR
jgi:myosin heavy subunit